MWENVGRFPPRVVRRPIHRDCQAGSGHQVRVPRSPRARATEAVPVGESSESAFVRRSGLSIRRHPRVPRLKPPVGLLLRIASEWRVAPVVGQSSVRSPGEVLFRFPGEAAGCLQGSPTSLPFAGSLGRRSGDCWAVRTPTRTVLTGRPAGPLGRPRWVTPDCSEICGRPDERYRSFVVIRQCHSNLYLCL